MSRSLFIPKQELLDTYTAAGTPRFSMPPDITVDMWGARHKAPHARAGRECVIYAQIFSDIGRPGDDFSVGVVPGDLSVAQRINGLGILGRRNAAELAESFTGDLVCVDILRGPRTIQTSLGDMAIARVNYGAEIQISSSEKLKNTGDPLPYIGLAYDALAVALDKFPDHGGVIAQG
ncbi:MAG TPA: hypothetical protein VGM08_04610 [Candidatus Saccharimonadales bacterium]|jgi:hypothetical protein